MLWRRKLRPWEEVVEAFIGAALCAETFAMLRVTGLRRFFRDRWRIFDAFIAVLTMLCGAFFLLRRAMHHTGDAVESIDVPILGLRFALQPVRMASTASKVVRAHRLRREAVDPPPPLPPVDPRRPCPGLSRSILSLDLAVQLRELLPCYLRFADWELGYAPCVHGTSMSTFYRQQGGPNLLVVRDVDGNIFGGFAPAEWRPTAGAYGGTEAFVFVARRAVEVADAADAGCESAGGRSCGADGDGVAGGDGALLEGDVAEGAQLQPQAAFARGDAAVAARKAADTTTPDVLEAFWAVPREGPSIVQWSDAKMLGLGSALVVSDDFLRGSSSKCETYCSPPLSGAGSEFIIRDFECWRIGASGD